MMDDAQHLFREFRRVYALRAFSNGRWPVQGFTLSVLAIGWVSRYR
jgi:hypothetical protein